MYGLSAGIVPSRHDPFLKAIAGDCNSETGNVEAPNGWNGLISIGSTDISRVAFECLVDVSEVADFKPGVYIIQINEQGLVWGHCYSTWAKASYDFALLEAAYAEWEAN